MKLIIGNTGLIGQTISEFIKFDHFFNSSNIDRFKKIRKDGDELFLSCLPSTKWLINQNLEDDLSNIYNIMGAILGCNYSKITLISTIDVYTDSPQFSNEEYSPNVKKLHYGSNRYLFEMLVRQFVKFDDLKIFRLGALFNNKIKKNIVFDLLNNNNTDMINLNSCYQWYNLDNISRDIEFYSKNYPNEVVFNLFTQPIETSDIVQKLGYKNIGFWGNRIEYNFKTKFSESGWIDNSSNVLDEILRFKNGYISK